MSKKKRLCKEGLTNMVWVEGEEEDEEKEKEEW